jgi:hypothetical protein
MARAIFVGIVFHKLRQVPQQFFAARRGGGDRLAAAPHIPTAFIRDQQSHTVYVLEMMRQAGVNENLDFYGLNEAPLFQQWLTHQFGIGGVRLSYYYYY